MARLHQRFRLWPKDGSVHQGYAEGVQFSDGTIAVRSFGAFEGLFMFGPMSVKDLVASGLFRRTPEIEWQDGAHSS